MPQIQELQDNSDCNCFNINSRSNQLNSGDVIRITQYNHANARIEMNKVEDPMDIIPDTETTSTTTSAFIC
jgi:hypothetical protein